jgi:hypothetical protein
MRYRNERMGRKLPGSGGKEKSAGPMPSGGPSKGVGFVKPDGATQPRNRSLGYRKVKTSMDEKGL